MGKSIPEEGILDAGVKQRTPHVGKGKRCSQKGGGDSRGGPTKGNKNGRQPRWRSRRDRETLESRGREWTLSAGKREKKRGMNIGRVYQGQRWQESRPDISSVPKTSGLITSTSFFPKDTGGVASYQPPLKMATDDERERSEERFIKSEEICP